jgi:hypothetical protein
LASEHHGEPSGGDRRLPEVNPLALEELEASRQSLAATNRRAVDSELGWARRGVV